MVMKSAEDRHGCDAAYVLNGAMDRSVFAKRPMSPQLIIISGIEAVAELMVTRYWETRTL